MTANLQQTTTARTEAENETADEDADAGARYGTRRGHVAHDGETVVIDVSDTEAAVRAEKGVAPENVARGREQAMTMTNEGKLDKRAATEERHANHSSYHTDVWGSTFNAGDAADPDKFGTLKRTQNTGQRGRGGKHTNKDANIFRQFRAIAKGVELPHSIQQRAGRLLHEVRSMPRCVCGDWGSELTIAACMVEAADEAGYALSFDEVYDHLPKHPDRDRDSARYRFEMARKEVDNRDRLDGGADDPVVNNIRLLGEALSVDSLTLAVAEGLYQTLVDGPFGREEAHAYGANPRSQAGGYLHAAADQLPDLDQESMSSNNIAEVLNLTSAAVSAPSLAIRKTVEGTTVSVPAFAGVEPFDNGGMLSTSELVAELQRLADDLGKSPSQDDMTDHGKYGTGTYRNRFGTWNDALRAAGLEPNLEQEISEADLIAELQRLADDLGTTPTASDVANHGEYGNSVYERRFGSWNDALRAAGLSPTREQGISEADLIDELQRLADDLGKSPSEDDMTDHGKYGTGTYWNRFGTWSKAKDQAGV